MCLFEPNTLIRKKNLIKECATYNEWYILIEKVNSQSILSEDGIEGYVFEDNSETPNMFKLKTDWYIFWKKFRGVQDRIVKQLRKTGIVDKSFLIEQKAKLHTSTDIKVFNAMVKVCEENFQSNKSNKSNNSINIIEMREEVIKRL
jgi:hypothetical protein